MLRSAEAKQKMESRNKDRGGEGGPRSEEKVSAEERIKRGHLAKPHNKCEEYGLRDPSRTPTAYQNGR